MKVISLPRSTVERATRAGLHSGFWPRGVGDIVGSNPVPGEWATLADWRAAARGPAAMRYLIGLLPPQNGCALAAQITYHLALLYGVDSRHVDAARPGHYSATLPIEADAAEKLAFRLGLAQDKGVYRARIAALALRAAAHSAAGETASTFRCLAEAMTLSEDFWAAFDAALATHTDHTGGAPCA